MADIAVVFHWDLPTLEAMSINDLALWREHARRRSGTKE